jgi:hypothetical protein
MHGARKVEIYEENSGQSVELCFKVMAPGFTKGITIFANV